MDWASLKEAVNSNKSVIITANCTISYNGRAETFLAEGDRIIIIKADRTILVHQPSGSVSINYMKNNTSFTVTEDRGCIFLNCVNEKEFMSIALLKVYSLSASELVDSQKIQLAGSERDMSLMIYNNPSMIEDGFTPLSTEEHTRFGFIDVFGYDKNNILVIVECKRYVADHKAVEQLNRYVEKVKETKGLPKVRGIIAAPKMSDAALESLRGFGFEFKSIQPPKYFEKFDSSQRKLLF